MFSLLRTLVRPLAVPRYAGAGVVAEWCDVLSPVATCLPESLPQICGTLRAKDPLHWSPLMEAWVATRYDHVDAMLRDQKRSPMTPPASTDPRGASDGRESRGQSMLFVDPPEHTRLRALVNKAFTRRLSLRSPRAFRPLSRSYWTRFQSRRISI